ncbi:MAG: hypothetical protein K2X01_05225 [Cyanobacteria bacterium]|nr:hypothetical protein [Cyanobacteriota bacterium]
MMTPIKFFNPKPVSQNTQSIQFSGITRLLPGRLWLSNTGLKQLCDAYQNDYLGKLPSDWVDILKKGQPPKTPKDVYALVDELTPVLQALNHHKPKFISGKLKGNHIRFTLRRVGSGNYGQVYRFQIYGNRQSSSSLALKVFHPEVSRSHKHTKAHGSWSESATGMWLSNKAHDQLARFYAANPRVGWNLIEFIDPNKKSPRKKIQSSPGEKRSNRGSKHSMNQAPTIAANFLDNTGENNIHGIRVDYGGISPQEETDNSFDKLLESINISTLPRFEDKFSTFARHARAKQIPLEVIAETQARMTQAIEILPRPQRLNAYLAAMGTELEVVQLSALNQIEFLPYSETFTAVIRGLHSRFESVQSKAAGLIKLIPLPQMKKAYELALSIAKTEDKQRVAEAAVSIITSFADEEMFALYRSAITSKEPYMQLAAVKMIQHLPEGERLRAYKLAMATKDSQIQTLAISQIGYLPIEIRAKAFSEIMTSPHYHLETKVALGHCLVDLGLDTFAAAKSAYLNLMRDQQTFKHIESLSLSY